MGCRYLIELEFSFSFFGIYIQGDLLDPMVALFLVFWGTSMLFSIEAAPIYNYSNVLGFPSLQIPANTCDLSSFWWRPGRQVLSDISLWFWPSASVHTTYWCRSTLVFLLTRVKLWEVFPVVHYSNPRAWDIVFFFINRYLLNEGKKHIFVVRTHDQKKILANTHPPGS